MRTLELNAIEEIRGWSFSFKGNKTPDAARAEIQSFLSGEHENVRFVGNDFTIVGDLYGRPTVRDGEAIETSCIAGIEKVQCDKRRGIGLLCKTRSGSLYLLRKGYQRTLGQTAPLFEW